MIDIYYFIGRIFDGVTLCFYGLVLLYAYQLLHWLLDDSSDVFLLGFEFGWFLSSFGKFFLAIFMIAGWCLAGISVLIHGEWAFLMPWLHLQYLALFLTWAEVFRELRAPVGLKLFFMIVLGFLPRYGLVVKSFIICKALAKWDSWIMNTMSVYMMTGRYKRDYQKQKRILYDPWFWIECSINILIPVFRYVLHFDSSSRADFSRNQNHFVLCILSQNCYFACQRLIEEGALAYGQRKYLSWRRVKYAEEMEHTVYNWLEDVFEDRNTVNIITEFLGSIKIDSEAPSIVKKFHPTQYQLFRAFPFVFDTHETTQEVIYRSRYDGRDTSR